MYSADGLYRSGITKSDSPYQIFVLRLTLGAAENPLKSGQKTEVLEPQNVQISNPEEMRWYLTPSHVNSR